MSSVYYNGKKHDHISKINEVIKGKLNLCFWNKFEINSILKIKGVESIEKVVIVPFCDDTIDDITNIPKSVSLSDFLFVENLDQCELTFEQVEFNHPLVILYSSGTTGTPVSYCKLK